jgi:hypothetical protein
VIDEKIMPGVWSLKGYFDLVDYSIVQSSKRRAQGYIRSRFRAIISTGGLFSALIDDYANDAARCGCRMQKVGATVRSHKP